jgi:Uma2 family endonuclease
MRPLPVDVPASLRVASHEHEVAVPPAAHSLAGFRAWALSDDFPETGRISYLDGEVFIDMSPESYEAHNKIKGELTYAIIKLNKRLKLGEVYSDRMLITNEQANVSTEPDAAFALWETLESGRLRMIPRAQNEEDFAELQGTPDWVLEIVSDSSVRKDTRRLRQLYHRANIPEYWLIDARGDEIAFQILVREDAEYVPSAAAGQWQASRVFGRRFRLTRKRGRMNLWQYTLESKAIR